MGWAFIASRAGIKMTGNKVIQTASVTPARVRVFQPTQRPTLSTGEWIDTSWGRCRVCGRLGQRHADILEAVLFCAERRKDEDAGTIKLLVDPARVRKVMSESRFSLEQCWKLLRELRACTIEIDTPKMRLMGGIIESAEYTKTETRHDPLTGLPRRLWTVRLGKAWTELSRLDLPLDYDPAPIARLPHGISQAVARHVLTHRKQPNGGWTLDGLIDAVAGVLGDQALKDARRRVRADASALRKIGIDVYLEGARVRRCVAHRPGDVAHPLDGVAHPRSKGRTRSGTSSGLSGSSGA